MFTLISKQLKSQIVTSKELAGRKEETSVK